MTGSPLQTNQSVVKDVPDIDYTCETVWVVPPNNQVTDGVIESDVPGAFIYSAKNPHKPTAVPALKQYAARVAMHTAEGNETDCSVRQYRLILPRLLVAKDGANIPNPIIQVTVAGAKPNGEGVAMIVYSIQHDDVVADYGTEYVISAQVPANPAFPKGYQSHYTYYANITVIGVPDTTVR